MYLRISTVTQLISFLYSYFFLQVYYWGERSLHKHSPHHVEKQILTFSGNHSHGMLPGLHPFTLYSFNVRVYNGKGEGPPSPTQRFETPEGGRRSSTITLQTCS